MPTFLGFCYGAFEPFVARRASTQASTRRSLRAARLPLFPELYLVLSYFWGLAATLLVEGCLAFALVILHPPFLLGAALVLAVGLCAFLAVRAAFLLYPRMRASSRSKRIDVEMPGVILLAYSLARGGVPTLEIFRAIAREREVYGEAAVEIGVVVREIDWFGADLNTALQSVGDTTPSPRLKAFVEGLATILSSGADPRDYFRRQASLQLSNAEVVLNQELEQAALLGELYVSGLLVLPLLVMVVLSALSPLGGGGESFLPFIVFGLVPLGTAGYLVLVDTMLPSETLAVARRKEPVPRDFGIERVDNGAPTLPGEEATARALSHTPVRDALRAFCEKALEDPYEALQVSGLAALLTLMIAGAFLWEPPAIWFQGPPSQHRAILLTTIGIVGLLVAALPVAVFHELRLRRIRAVEGALPESLGRLAGFNERGIGLLQAFAILGRVSTGPLARELRNLGRDVSWNRSLRAGLARMRSRVRTPRMTKLGVVLEHASAATGDVKEVLEVAAREASILEDVRARKRASMMSYVIVIYVVFAVFLYVVYMVATLFFGPHGFAAASKSSGGGVAGMDPAAARMLFFQASIVQGGCAGLVAGRLGEGHLLSGVKHAAICVVLAWIVFMVGVF